MRHVKILSLMELTYIIMEKEQVQLHFARMQLCLSKDNKFLPLVRSMHGLDSDNFEYVYIYIVLRLVAV